MLRGRRAAIAAAFAITATAAVTAGCGGASHAVALDPVSAAAAKTQSAGPARIRLDIAVRGQGKALRLHGTGAVDGTSGEMSFDLGSLNASLGQLMHGKMTVISLEQNGDYVIYLRLGVLSSQIPGGKQWIKLDVSKLGKSAGVDLGSLMSGSQLSPSDLLGVLQSADAKVQKVGTAQVGGTTTTHYRVRVDVAKALRAQGLTSPLLSSIPTKMKALSSDVWIGQDGLVRRVTFAYGGSPSVAMTMDVYAYGSDITITAPPSSQVFDATQYAQQGISSGLIH